MAESEDKPSVRKDPSPICIQMCKRFWTWLTNGEGDEVTKSPEKKDDTAKPEVEKASSSSSTTATSSSSPATAAEPYVTDNVMVIVKIQSFFRSWKIRKLYKRFLKNPSINAIREFANRLDPLDIIFLQKLEIIDLKEEVITKMRRIQELKEKLSSWDKKISALVNGKKMLEDLVSQFPKLQQKNKRRIQKLMSMDRENMSELMKRTEKLEPYQHLFYHLQTDPKYLSKLICHMSPSEYTTFGERLLCKLYNNISTPREEYHLVKCLKSALRYEVAEKCTKMSDILGGSLMVIKAVFRFYRQAAKYNVLLQELTPVIKEITSFTFSIKDKPLVIRDMAGKVLKSIYAESIPYGVRSITKVLRRALQQKFPRASEDEVLGILGLFLYQYLQPVIEASDGFGPTADELDFNPLQKENLMTVATLVHHTMSINLFPTEHDDASALNVFILRNCLHFRRYFEALCEIADPEAEFAFDFFSDTIAPKDPVIELPAVDIVETHALLLKYEAVVFPDRMDILSKILKDLGPVPHWKDLLSEDAAADNRDEALSRTEICLSLSSKYVQPMEKYLETETLVVITEKLLLDLIRVQPGESFSDVLQAPISPEQIEKHETLMRDTTVDSTNAPQTVVRIVNDHHLPLDKKKEKIVTNLNSLKVAQNCGLIKAIDYQIILNKIAKSISRRKELRLQQEAELTRFRDAVDALDAQSRYYEAKIDQYNMFGSNCLENLVSQRSYSTRMAKKEGEIKYTASKLHKKGVIVASDRKTNEWKREMLTIGIEADHQIKVSMGEMSVYLHGADIINLHYSSKPTKEIFGYDVNVSLLLFMVYSKGSLTS